jgi:hypothetical protein
MLNDDEKWYRVSLRFFGEGLDVSSVAAKIGLNPDIVGQLGEHHRGNPRYALYETNLWVHRSTTDDGRPFCDQLTELTARLEERADSIRALTSAPGVGGELFLGFSSGNGQGGFTLPAELLARISALGLDLSLDLYPPTDLA